jgi:hypothetical protein
LTLPNITRKTEILYGVENAVPRGVQCDDDHDS